MMGMGRLTAQERFTGLALLVIGLVVVGFVLLVSHSSNTSPSSPPSTYAPASKYTDPADVKFLETMHSHVWDVSAVKGTDLDDTLIKGGRGVCGDLEMGHTRASVHDQLVSGAKGWSDSDASWLITAAVAANCPDAG